MPMMEFIQGKVSDRKWRLFLCGCVRTVWRLLEDDRSRKAVEMAEGYLDRQVTVEQLIAAYKAAWDATWDGAPAIAKYAAFAAYRDAAFAAFRDTVATFRGTEWGRYKLLAKHWDSSWEGERARVEDAVEVSATTFAGVMHTTLFRDLFGNPFHPVSISPAVLAWNDALVVRIAQAAYEERQLPEGTLDNGRLAVLADALEEAGCTDADILGHCRGAGPHVRGCWPLDLILGKS
jgi:hypothetical protein